MTGGRRQERGFAILVVLWTVALLALLSAYILADARARVTSTGDLRQAATLEEAADGATQHAIFRFLDESASRWSTDGVVHDVRIGPDTVSVLLRDEAGKLNPNTASMAALRSLLERISRDPHEAAPLAAAIVAWRTPGRPLAGQTDFAPGIVPRNAGSSGDHGIGGRPFRRINELGLVRGMTPELLRRLRPHLTLYTGSDPDLDSSAEDAGPSGAIRVVSIVAVAHGAGRTMFAKHVIVRTNARRSGRRYEILMSERGGGDDPYLNADAEPYVVDR